MIAVTALIGCLKDNDELIRGNAAFALGKIRPKGMAVIQALRRLLKDKKDFPRAHAGLAIWRITKKIEVVSVLTTILKHNNDAISAKYVACVGLGEIGPAAKDAVATLIMAAHSKSIIVREAAREALMKVAPKAASDAGIK